VNAKKPLRFNVQGPSVPTKHYLLPPLTRLPEALDLIRDNKPFIIKAPPQSGKTTFARAAVDQINAEGSKYAIYLSLKGLAAIIDGHEAMSAIIDRFELALAKSQVKVLRSSIDHSPWDKMEETRGKWVNPLISFLTSLIAGLDKELAIFFDDVDCLAERPLRFFLSELREGYVEWGEEDFPRAIALLSVTNVGGVTTKAQPEPKSMDLKTPFYDAKKVLTLPDFTQEDIRALFARHTKATGQIFLDVALECIWRWSSGQPWVVNAIGDEIFQATLTKGKCERTIDASTVSKSAIKLVERLYNPPNAFLARATEPGVREILEEMAKTDDLSWVTRKSKTYPEEFKYNLQRCLDLGLITEEPKLLLANTLYYQVLERYFIMDIEEQVIDILLNDTIEHL
jgi:hypothetical protein